MTQHLCLTCGGALIEANGSWACKYCGNVYGDESVQRDTDMLRALLDEQKIEQVSNLRRNLYDALNAKYIDSEQICSICTRIKEYLPDDFMASFYYIANCGNRRETAEYITYINAEDNLVYVEGILNFLLRSFCAEYHLPISGLIERAYRKTDLEKFERYSTLLSEEAEKEDLGVYETRIPRDVFVAYSSKDMESVYALVAYLEASGLKCFVAARNLRHGQGARQNYDAALREAILNCEAVVFVSSPNSRSFSCDAIKKELPFIKQNDINNAPYEFKQNYASMPYTYKMPRVEYRLAESRTPNAADSVVKEFFESCEFAYTPEEVGTRLIRLLEEKKNRHLRTESASAPAEPSEKKYCAECGTEAPIASKFCGECGNREFVASRAAYEELKTRKKIAEQEKLEREEQQKKLAEQQRQIDEARRAAEEERKKAEAERRKAEAERRKAEEEKQRQSTPSYTPRPTSTSSTSTSSRTSSYTSPSVTVTNTYSKPKKKSKLKRFIIVCVVLGVLSSLSSLLMERGVINPDHQSTSTAISPDASVTTELTGKPISTAEQLKALTDSKGDFYLASDIDLGGAEWTPISGFEGKLNGNGHTIKNFKITKGSTSIGLFSGIYGSVTNLSVEGAEIDITSSGEDAGIICGTSSGYLSNIHVSGTVNAPSFNNVGGIAGRIFNNEGDTALELCDLSSTAQVTGESKVGGIAGLYERDTSWYVENHIKNLSNEGEITAKKDYAGGIFGYVNTDLGYLYADGLENSGSVEGQTRVGGIFGLAKSELGASYIKNASNSSSIKAEAFCGAVSGELVNIYIDNCNNDGTNIEATGYVLSDGEKHAMVGGFVGKGTYALNCTNTAGIYYEGGGNYVGGIIGCADFEKRDETKVENLKNEASIYGASYVGGIFGYFKNTASWYVPTYHNKLENSGEVNGSGDYVGGVFGYVDSHLGYTYIESASNSGRVNGKTRVGGIVGYGVSQLVESYIQNSSNSAEVSAEAVCGAIAGELDLIFIEDCSNENSIVSVSDYIIEDGQKNAYLGGFVGKGFYASNCTNKINLNYTGAGNYVGGIIGCASFDSDKDITLENLKNEGEINGASYVGGIIGSYTHESSWYRVNQFDVIENAGKVSGSGNYVGGCVGHIDVTLGYLYMDSASNTGAVSGKKYFGDVVGFATAKTDGCYISGSTTAGGKICGTYEKITIK